MTRATGPTPSDMYRGAMAETALHSTSFDLPIGSAITTVTRDVAAPAALVYEMMAAIGQGPQSVGDGATVLSRDGAELVCEFRTTVPIPVLGHRIVRTREAVRLMPPDGLGFRHLDGPVRGLVERIRVEPLDERRSRMSYEAVLPGSGLASRLRFAIARRAIEKAVAEHFADIAGKAEARATRSRVHGPARAATED